MTRPLYLLTAIVLLLAGLGVTADQFTYFFDADIDAARFDTVREGAVILKTLLCADALLLFALAAGLAPLLQGYRCAGTWQPRAKSAMSSFPVVNHLLLAAGVLLLAMLLRVIGLDTDLWMDEVFTLVNIVRLPAGELVTFFPDDNQHLFYSLLAHFSVWLFGESHWALRLPAVIFGVASIWVTMRLAMLVYGERVAVLSGLLLALSWHHIWFSQNARGYTLLLFGTVLATEMLLRGLWQGRWRDWIVYAIVIALSAWAHLTAVFVALAHGLVVLSLLLVRRRPLRTAWMPLAGFMLAAWFTLHLYALVLPQLLEFFTRPGGGSGVTQVEWRNPLWLFNEVFQAMGVDAAFGWAGVSVVLFVLGLCAWWYLKRDAVFVLLAFLPGLLLGTTMFLLGRNLWPRMFFNEAGFIVILLVVGMLAAGEYVRKKLLPGLPGWLPGVPVLALCAVFAWSLPGLYRLPKQDFTGAREYVLEQMSPGDRVVGLHVTGRVYNQYYAGEWAEVNSLQELEQHRPVTGHTWVLYTLPNFIESVMPDVARVMQEDYELMREFPGTLGDGAIIVRRSR